MLGFRHPCQDTKANYGEITQGIKQNLVYFRFGTKRALNSVLKEIHFLVYLFRNCLEPTILPARDELSRQLPFYQMNRCIEYMNTVGKSDFRLRELCAEIGTSPSRFIRLFKNSANRQDPHTYFNVLIIEKARKMLISLIQIPERTQAYGRIYETQSFHADQSAGSGRGTARFDPGRYKTRGSQDHANPFLPEPEIPSYLQPEHACGNRRNRYRNYRDW